MKTKKTSLLDRSLCRQHESFSLGQVSVQTKEFPKSIGMSLALNKLVFRFILYLHLKPKN